MPNVNKKLNKRDVLLVSIVVIGFITTILTKEQIIWYGVLIIIATVFLSDVHMKYRRGEPLPYMLAVFERMYGRGPTLVFMSVVAMFVLLIGAFGFYKIVQ